MLQNRWILYIGFISFTITFFLFYPKNTGIVDENAYLSMAYAFGKFKLHYEDAGISSAPASTVQNQHLVSRYPPGNSLLLVPFTIIHWRFSFLRGYLLMVAGFLITILLLSHFHLPHYYSLFFLFHPSFILYSRTLMSDLPATIFGLLGLFFFLKKKILTAGIVFGFSIALRYPMVLIPLSFLIIFFLKKDFASFVKFFTGNIIGIIPLSIYHIIVFDNLIGPAPANIIGFSIKNFPLMFIQFFIMLNILYPFMVVSSCRTELPEKWFFIAPAAAFILFFSFQYYIDTGRNFLETLILGQRYMLPVIPFLLVPYIEVLKRIKISENILLFFIVLLFSIDTAVTYKHQVFLKRQDYYQNKLYEYIKDADVVLCNKDIYELINPFIKPIKWQNFEDRGKLKEIDISGYSKNLYLACLTRDDRIKKLFFEFLDHLQVKKEVYKEETSFYHFSIWKID
ncbi:MAG: hypothetical protein N3A65_06895 [candidate division WOR-3 bacterium]|nr:hypothetical protein [candidate division WOR-3 bacterium]